MEKTLLFVPRFALFTLLLLTAAASPVMAAQNNYCSCGRTCPNGSSCTAKGTSGCDCYCSFWTGNAICTASGSASVSLSSDELSNLLMDSPEAFIENLSGALGGNADPLCENVRAAAEALAAQDDEAYAAALDKMDVSLKDLSSADEALVQQIAKGGGQ